MRWPGLSSMSLMAKLPLTITLVVFAAALIIGLVVIDRDWHRQHGNLEAQTLVLARTMAAAGKPHVVNRDVWALYRLLQQLQDRDGKGAVRGPFVEAAFIEADGTVLAHSDPARNPVGLKLGVAPDDPRLDWALGTTSASLLSADMQDAGFVDAAAPITVDGVTVGVFMLRSSTAGLIAQFHTDVVVVLAFALGLALIISLIGTWLTRRMVRPLQTLTDGLDAVGRGDLSAVQPVKGLGHDEIGQLTIGFNQMVAELEEKRKLEQELAKSRKLAGLGRFTAGLAHEVNNPIGGMLNCVQALSRHPEDADLVRRYVPLLDKGLRRISTTIRTLLGELRGECNSTLCAAGCLSDMEGMVRAEIGERPITLDWNVSMADLGGLALRCTCPHLNQIVTNLTRNAIAVMPDGGRLWVTTRKIDDTLELEVHDTGPGIDEETQDRLFEPFFSTRPDGSGLGLWITFRIVDDMGGTIRVKSRPGQGACFTVSLPLTKAGATPMGVRIRAA